MITNDEIKQWAQIAESLNGQINISAYVLFDSINEAYKEDSKIINRLRVSMGNQTNMNKTQIESFIKEVDKYCSRY